MKLTIITSCSKPENLSKLFESIRFEHVEKWIIVYSKPNYIRKYKSYHNIVECECFDEGVLGFPQKNFGLKFVNSGSVYFLDDDTIMHPDLWNNINKISEDNIYLFDQESYLYFSPESTNLTLFLKDLDLQVRSSSPKTVKAHPVNLIEMHVGMFIVPYKYIMNINMKFIPYLHYSAGYFILSFIKEYKEKCVYFSNILSYGKAIKN